MNRVLLKKDSNATRCKSLRNINSTGSTNDTGNCSLFPPLISYKSLRARKKIFIVNKESDCEHLVSGYYKLLKQKSQYSERIKILKNNMRKIEQIQSKYKYNEPINFKITSKSLIKLEIRAKSIYNLKIRKLAVEKIEHWWKTIIIRRKINDSIKKINMSATTIQYRWRKYISDKKRRMLVDLINKAAIMIQKCFRGYLARKKMSLAIKEARMNKVFQFFSDQRLNLLRLSALVIRRYWIDYKRRKNIRKVLEPAIKCVPILEAERTAHSSNTINSIKQALIPKYSGFQKQSSNNRDVHSLGPARARALTDVMFTLDAIKEVKGK